MYTPTSERTPIHLEELAWRDHAILERDLSESNPFQPGTFHRALIEPTPDRLFVYVRFAPNHVTPEHWHPSPTIYIVTQGEFHVAGEGVYRAGDFRWVGGGFAYGTESAGPEGCEFYLGSLGPFATYDPNKVPPPRGSWRDALPPDNPEADQSA